MLKLPSASVHVKRHLTVRELSTIAVALELLAQAPDGEKLEDIVVSVATDNALLSDEEMRALSFELTRARKVKVCRTKQSQS